MTDANRQIHKACAALERYRLETYAKIEISRIIREDRTLLIKPSGECDIREIHVVSSPDDILSAKLHTELYSRYPDVSSILLVKPEWIGVASNAGWTLDPASYGYIPSFADTVTCTKKIRTPADSADYPKAFCDAIADIVGGGQCPRAALVRSCGAVIFASSPMDAAEYATTLEYAAKKAFYIRKLK